jgi:succinoglycan biosynthesis protein ExoA
MTQSGIGVAGQADPEAVCIIVPTLNEELYIDACLTSLLAQQDATVLEIIVADGGSTDRTIDLVRNWQRDHPCIVLLHNPRRIQSAAINLAVATAHAQARIIIRADAHVSYPQRFVSDCVAAMIGYGATSVVVPMRTVGIGGFQRAVAAAQNSVLGNGGSPHRSAGRSGFVDHGHHAAFDRDFFTRLGGYNETFTHNEDAEFDYRQIQAGGRIYLCGDNAVTYFPRSRLRDLAVQYLRHGRGRARTTLTHRIRPKLRQLAPILMLAANLAGIALIPVSVVFGLVPLVYLAGCCLIGVGLAIQRRDPWLLAAGLAAVTMHAAFALGYSGACLRYACAGPVRLLNVTTGGDRQAKVDPAGERKAL